MRAPKLASAVAAFALAASLVACGGSPASYGHELLDEAEGIRVTAENADNTHTATTDGAFELEQGDVIVISPFLDKGSIHVTITSEDGKTTVYDDDADGKVMFTVAAEPGTYNVTTTANNATGWMTIFAESGQDLAEQNAALADKLEEDGVDPSVVPGISADDDDADDADDTDDVNDADDADDTDDVNDTDDADDVDDTDDVNDADDKDDVNDADDVDDTDDATDTE